MRPRRQFRVVHGHSTCAQTGKIRYSSAEEAEIAKGRAEWVFKHGMKPYECPYCAGWHLTTEREERENA